MNPPTPLFRAFPLTGPECEIFINDRPVRARAGQSVLTVILEHAAHVREHETNGEPRAGFCLMGACQDCWIWTSPHQRGRSCTTPAQPGMRIYTRNPDMEASLS